jgi:hypothetical protein
VEAVYVNVRDFLDRMALGYRPFMFPATIQGVADPAD